MVHISARAALAATASAIALSACSLTAGSGEDPAKSNDSNNSGKGAPVEVVLLTHESFSLPKPLIKQFETDTGNTLTIRPAGDAGELTNKLALSQGNPQGDVAFGVDNTFAGVALENDVFESAGVEIPEALRPLALPDAEELVPVDTASVCVNIDTQWFEDKQLSPPASLDDLTKPEYEGLFVTPAATTSSPGMAFLLATIAEYGDGWQEYWSDLVANDTLITAGWSDAYQVDFTQGGGEGERPIVLSYDSSPAFTVGEDGQSTTKALLNTCFRQVEYAGVLAGTEHPEQAADVVEWLISPEVQAALPESMYVFPADPSVSLPTDWAKFAEQPTEPLSVDADEIAEQRRQWLTEWTDITTK